MHLRAAHAELNIPSLRKFIRDNPLGILITALPSSNFPTLQCTHIPWVLDVVDEHSETELGTLRGHLAKANPQSKAMVEAVQTSTSSSRSLAQEILILFNGPVDSYVTPKFYTKTKPETGKVVPTWNYSAVQAYGTATIFFDTHHDVTGSFLQKQIHDLTQHAEKSLMQHTGGSNPNPWEVSDAPPNYTNMLKKNIIGIEIEIKRLEGKFKMSQEMGREDRGGVVKGFEARGTESGREMARTVKERGDLRDRTKAANSAA